MLSANSRFNGVALLESQIAHVDVGLVDAGDDGPAAEIVDGGAGAYPPFELVERPDGDDGVTGDRQCARQRARVVHGDDVRVSKNAVRAGLRRPRSGKG